MYHVRNAKECLQGRGAWSVILRIDSVQKSDTEKEYALTATNNEGSYEYRMVLSTSSVPAGELFEKFDLRKLSYIEDVKHRALLETRILYISKIYYSTSNKPHDKHKNMCGVSNTILI